MALYSILRRTVLFTPLSCLIMSILLALFLPSRVEAESDVSLQTPQTDSGALNLEPIGIQGVTASKKMKLSGRVRLSQKIAFIAPSLTSNVVPTAMLTELDKRNMDMLWSNVVSNNPIIQFGLRQLATPPELRQAHLSSMNRVLGGLLSGAAILPYYMGAGGYAMGATSVGTNMVDRAVRKTGQIDPSTLPSDMELVQLSDLAESLQSILVRRYFDYKYALQASNQWDNRLQELQALYDSAIASQPNEQSLMTVQMYHHAQQQQLRAQHSASESFLTLERLVGPQGMQAVRFSPKLSASVSEELP
jgi:hypothetical protein